MHAAVTVELGVRPSSSIAHVPEFVLTFFVRCSPYLARALDGDVVMHRRSSRSTAAPTARTWPALPSLRGVCGELLMLYHFSFRFGIACARRNDFVIVGTTLFPPVVVARPL
jgi:hypothetical protein